MAKQEINLGSAPNAGDGDPLRTAFNKINENFDELYNSTGGLDLLNVASNVIPATDNTYDLGSPAKRWKHGYFATGSLYVGDLKLSNDGGTLLVQQVTNAGLITEAPVPDSPGVVTTDRIINGANTFSITAAGELELNGSPFTGSGGDTGNVVFDENTLYVGGTGFLNLETDTGVAVIGTNGPEPLLVSINEDDKIWTFAPDGSITLPAGGTISYTPDDTDNWNEPAVNTVQAALDELAARVTALQNFEIDGGNAYTPPEGELQIDGNRA